MKKLLALIVLIGAVTAVFAESASDIMKKVADGSKSNSSAMELTMQIVSSSGAVSERKIQTLSMKSGGKTSTITLFLAPASVKNTRFLSIDNPVGADDQWIFLPALNKVKRIAAGEKDSSFMGSDFSYSDMSSMSMADSDGSHTLLREEMYGGTACYVIESRPTGGATSYGKTISWIAKDKYVAMKVEFYHKDASTLVKTLTTGNVSLVSGRWLARTMTMQSVSGSKTVVTISQVKFDISVDPGYFTQYYLKTGRPQ